MASDLILLKMDEAINLVFNIKLSHAKYIVAERKWLNINVFGRTLGFERINTQDELPLLVTVLV